MSVYGVSLQFSFIGTKDPNIFSMTMLLCTTQAPWRRSLSCWVDELKWLAPLPQPHWTSLGWTEPLTTPRPSWMCGGYYNMRPKYGMECSKGMYDCNCQVSTNYITITFLLMRFSTPHCCVGQYIVIKKMNKSVISLLTSLYRQLDL